MKQLPAIATLCVAGALTTAAMAQVSGLRPAAAKEGQRLALEQGESTAAIYLWADKYVYQPGESAVVRWTVKPNGDLYPYTVFAYRVNNQTGVKTFLPGGTTAATDITGRTADQGYQVGRLNAADKQVVIGPGGIFPAAAGLIPNELGMHTVTVELRDFTGTRILKTAYFKLSVVDGFEDLTGNVDADRTLVNTRAYRLRGIVFVRNNATLTVQPGTVILGQPSTGSPSTLIVTRNGRINASGTRTRPIIMTSSLPFGQRNRGDWGGIVLLGRAPINVGANAAASGPNQAGEFFIEGTPANPDTVYGDATSPNPGHNCGTLRYVRVEYAGSILSPNNELNSFTWGGCGTGTTAEYLQAIYGLDDSFEWFGGTMNAKHLVGGLGADDYVDYQLGWTGKLQYGLFYQSADARGNRGIEGDNSEYNNSATPFSDPTIYNVTFIGSGQPGFDEANSPGIYLRRGARGTINNAIVTNFSSTGVFVDNAPTVAQLDAGNIRMNGILLWRNSRGTNGADTLAGNVQADILNFAQETRGQGRNFLVADPLFRRGNDFSDPDFRPAFGSPIYRANWVQPPDDGFFENARFVGAFGEIDWTEEWTNFLQEADVRP